MFKPTFRACATSKLQIQNRSEWTALPDHIGQSPAFLGLRGWFARERLLISAEN